MYLSYSPLIVLLFSILGRHISLCIVYGDSPSWAWAPSHGLSFFMFFFFHSESIRMKVVLFNGNQWVLGYGDTSVGWFLICLEDGRVFNGTIAGSVCWFPCWQFVYHTSSKTVAPGPTCDRNAGFPLFYFLPLVESYTISLYSANWYLQFRHTHLQRCVHTHLKLDPLIKNKVKIVSIDCPLCKVRMLIYFYFSWCISHAVPGFCG